MNTTASSTLVRLINDKSCLQYFKNHFHYYQVLLISEPCGASNKSSTNPNVVLSAISILLGDKRSNSSNTCLLRARVPARSTSELKLVVAGTGSFLWKLNKSLESYPRWLLLGQHLEQSSSVLTLFLYYHHCLGERPCILTQTFLATGYFYGK